MITLYHLNKSRSKRIIWLLEELGVEYQIEAFQRDKETSLAPEALKAIHPLGKSPVIKDDDLVIAESGAMTEYLIDKYAADRLAPQRGTPEYVEYLQWLHFAESSAMVPLLLKMFLRKDGCKTNFLEGYADGEALKILTYLSEQLEGKDYLVGNQLSGADIMVFFVVDMVEQSGSLAFFPVLEAYLKRLRTHEACQKAEQLEKELG
ncbi:glutathione S-transferase family protein [Pseudomaricurvus sp.]|uniref:glutathione S-transferase family protein n=1 Tax=Pseudomaricurvus sp. TaxID=2004510 RepID=UPI003F6BA702